MSEPKFDLLDSYLSAMQQAAWEYTTNRKHFIEFLNDSEVERLVGAWSKDFPGYKEALDKTKED